MMRVDKLAVAVFLRSCLQGGAMSLFDYPRINLTGVLTVSPGTANNDDYAGAATLPEGYGPYTGQTLALIDSKRVEPRTYGMSDADFIAWVQKAQTFDVQGGKQREIIPAEWNYYGGMGMNLGAAKVIGVTTGPGQVHTSPDSSLPVTALLGSTLTFTGGTVTDVNSEGSPPATQFFIDNLSLEGSQPWLAGAPSKGACQWLNFYRNVNLTADGGAGGYVYHVLRKGAGATIAIPGFEDPRIVGVILRYYLFQASQTTVGNEAIEALYAQKKANSSVVQLVATLAPLYANETIFTGPVGRLMVADTPNVATPRGSQNNGQNGLIALGPAVLAVDGDRISADFSGTFPDYFQAGANPKYDFGPVSLAVADGGASAPVGTVSYADTAAGNQGGWLFDFDISANPAARQILASAGGGTFQLRHGATVVLAETDYYVVSNQQAVYGEQGGSGTELVNQGSPEPASVAVFRRGQQLAAGACPPLTVWWYASVPLQAPGNAEAIATAWQPGRPIPIATAQPGNFLLTFTVAGQAPPPASYGTFMFPPFITNWPQISLRLLPNGEDFSSYYVDPAAAEPVGNARLTFEVLYQKVLRTYYLLYPAMNKIFQLNEESAVAPNAQAILDATETAAATWMSSHYMPRTRDLSRSRRTLLRAWCRKVLAEK
jgi:hypothetical protein